MSYSLCYDGYNQHAHTEVSMTLRSANGGGERNDACPKVAYGLANDAHTGFPIMQETAQTQKNGTCPGYESGVVQSIGFKAGQSANGGLGNEREVSPTLSHNPSALEPTVAIATILSQMRYIVRRLTPTECMRLMGLPDDYAVPTGLRRFFDANGEPDPELVAEFQRIFVTFNAIMYEYALASYERSHREGEPPPKPPKPKSAKQVADWLKKVSDPATCPDSPMYKAAGNGWATNQPRWILMRLLAADGIDPFCPAYEDSSSHSTTKER